MTIEKITGRDGYILRQALAYAIAVQQALPEEHQQWSNLQDMRTLMRAFGGDEFDLAPARGDVALLQGKPAEAVRATVLRALGIAPGVVSN